MFRSVSIIALQLSLESYTGLSLETIMDCIEEQSTKAPVSIALTELGMNICFSDKQSKKAKHSIVFTVLGITTVSSDEHSENSPYLIAVTVSGISTRFKCLFPFHSMLIR